MYRPPDLHTVWLVIFMGANFCGKSEKALKINFVVINFMTATSPGAWHCCINDDVINTHTHDLLCLILSHTYRDLDK